MVMSLSALLILLLFSHGFTLGNELAMLDFLMNVLGAKYC
jgi:hypothetical protein